MLEIELSLPAASEHVPRCTRWYVLAQDQYPKGSIEIYPAKEGGVAITFPHQSRNVEGDPKVPWRSGKICVDENVKSLGRLGGGREPQTAAGRLQWHVGRAVSWIAAAAGDRLTQAGEPFELPDFGRESSLTVAFSETAESFESWRKSGARAGIATLRQLRTVHADVRLLTKFESNEVTILTSAWRDSHLAKQESHALWLRLPQIPVLPAWHAPRTWREFRDATRAMSFDLDAMLRAHLGSIRQEATPLVLVGFPIPEFFGEGARHLRWEAIRLPRLGVAANGWRNNESGLWRRERSQILADESPVRWIAVENWAREQISRRSRLKHLSQRRVLLIGGGAIGSLVGELLVRGGLSDLVVMDPDNVQVGNLVRHTLAIPDVKGRKANTLADHLNNLGPATIARPYPASFPPEGNQPTQGVIECDTVIDCTGEDDVLEALATFPWKDGTRLISLSVGLGAKRLYCDAQSHPFDVVGFHSRVNPFLVQDHAEFTDALPWDATGCWHPLFPGRLDELWSVTAVAVGRLEAWLDEDAPNRFFVVERLQDGGIAIR